MFSTRKNLENFIQNKKFKKIFILTGKKSYILSGAKNIFKNLLKRKITLLDSMETIEEEGKNLSMLFS